MTNPILIQSLISNPILISNPNHISNPNPILISNPIPRRTLSLFTLASTPISLIILIFSSMFRFLISIALIGASHLELPANWRLGVFAGTLQTFFRVRTIFEEIAEILDENCVKKWRKLIRVMEAGDKLITCVM